MIAAPGISPKTNIISTAQQIQKPEQPSSPSSPRTKSPPPKNIDQIRPLPNKNTQNIPTLFQVFQAISPNTQPCPAPGSKLRIISPRKQEPSGVSQISPRYARQGSINIYQKIAMKNHQKYEDAQIEMKRIANCADESMSKESASMRAIGIIQLQLADGNFQNKWNEFDKQKKTEDLRKTAIAPLRMRIPDLSQPFGIHGLGFKLPLNSPVKGKHHAQSSSSNIVIMNGKLIHRKILEEFEPSQSQIDAVTHNQIVLMRASQREPKDLSQAANQLSGIPTLIEEQLPPWHQLEKLLRTTANSSLYQQMIAITDITPPIPEPPQISAQAPVIQRISPMQRTNVQSYKLDSITQQSLSSPKQKTSPHRQFQFKIHCINPTSPSEGSIYTAKWTQYRTNATNDLLSQLTSRSNELNDPQEQYLNEENKRESEMGLFMSQFAQMVQDTTNVVREEIIEFDERRHQIISHLVVNESESREFSSLCYIWRDNSLSIKNSEHYSHEKLLHYTLQALSLLNQLNENLNLYTNGDPLSLMTVNPQTQQVSFNYDLMKQPLQMKFGSDQYNHEYSMAHVNRLNSNNPNALYPIKVIHRPSEPLPVSKRASSISKSSSIKESPVYQIVMMPKSDVVKNEKTQLALSIQNIYNEQCSQFGFQKCEVLESLLFLIINGEDTHTLLSTYLEIVSKRPQYAIDLSKQLLKENKKKAVTGILSHCNLYQQLLGQIEIGEKLLKSGLSNSYIENAQSIILIAIKSAHDQALKRKLVLSSTQLFDATILKFMGVQPQNTQNEEYTSLQQDEGIDYTLPSKEHVLLCLESLLYRPKSQLQGTLQTHSQFLHYCAENGLDEMLMHGLVTELKLLANGQNQYDLEKYQSTAEQALEISQRLALKQKEIEIIILLGNAISKPMLQDKLQQIIESYTDTITETCTQYQTEYVEIMNFKYISALIQAKSDDSYYREALICQEQILKVSRQIYGDTHEQSMRAFFRASMLRLKTINRDQPQSASLASYPSLKITHQAVFIVLIEVYAEFRELNKLQELLDLVYNQPIIPQIAASQISLSKLHLALKIQEIDSEILSQLRLPLTESDHLECLQTLIHCCLSSQHLIQGYPSLYRTMLCYIDKYQHMLPGERNRIEKAQAALTLLIDYNPCHL